MSTLTRRLLLRHRHGSGAPIYYISPTLGNDSFSGLSTSAPFLTFAHALPLLTPGSTLVLMDGTYNVSNSGLPQITAAASCVSGTAGARITMRAQNERAALIDMTGSSGAVFGLRCEMNNWNIVGIRVLGADINVGNPKSNISIGDASGVQVLRCLSEFPNRYGNVHPIEFENCTDCLAEECEVFSFHRHGILGYTSDGLIYRRCYGSDRRRADLGGGYVSNRTTGGDEGMSFYGSNNSIMENCILEGNNEGFQIHGYPRDGDHTGRAPGEFPGDDTNWGGTNNQILGCIFLGGDYTAPHGYGMKLDSREYPSAHEALIRLGGNETTTVQLKSTADANNDYYNGWRIRIIAGTGIGESTTVTDYDGSTKIVTVSPGFSTTLDATSRYRINSDKFWPCKDNVVKHLLVMRADKGIVSESGDDNHVSYATISNMNDQDGVQIRETNGGTTADFMCPTIGCAVDFTYVLFYQGTDYGFTHRTADSMTSAIRKCNAFGANLAQGFFNYFPNESETDASGNVQDSFMVEPTNLFPDQGDFTPVWVNPASNMWQKASDGENIGCTILYRYQDGVLTSEPLWDPATGAFPRGALVAGVNDTTGVDAESVWDIHSRTNGLNISPTTLPAVYP